MVGRGQIDSKRKAVREAGSSLQIRIKKLRRLEFGLLHAKYGKRAQGDDSGIGLPLWQHLRRDHAGCLVVETTHPSAAA